MTYFRAFRCALFLSLFGSVCVEAKPPHILLIVTDDLGWQDLQCQGNPRLRTPNIDRLASQGMRFTQAYAASPVCSPTRAALMTGLAPARLGITQHGDDGPQFWPDGRSVQPPRAQNELPHDAITLAERLKEQEYATGFFGKWHLGDTETYWPESQGFDVNVGGCGYGGPPTYFDPYRIPTLPPRKPGEYLTDRLADEAVAFMRDRHQDPMLVCLWTYNPHYPFEAPDHLIRGFQGKEGPGLKNAVYGAQIEATDAAIGRVLSELDDLQIAEDTIVIFTSDNGGWSGATDNRPARAGKGYLYEGGLRIPLVVRWPGVVKAATTNATPVVSMDLPVTILDAVGIAPSTLKDLDGLSLRPILQGGKLERDTIYFHYPHFAFHKANAPGSALRFENYKLIMRYDPQRTTELYDLNSDFSETIDLSSQHVELTKTLKKRLSQWLKETNAAIPVPVSDE